MYAQLLAQGDKQFERAVARPGIFQHPSPLLRSVLDAVHRCQSAGGVEHMRPQDLQTLLTRIFTWRTTEPTEYAGRGATNGVGYRLWMEAKQILQNNTRQDYIDHADPQMPVDCPGNLVLGTYVPPDPDDGPDEICHVFTYRWLVASGRLPYSPIYGDGKGVNVQTAPGLLFPPGYVYQPANLGGHILLRAGDLIGMFSTVVAIPTPGHAALAGPQRLLQHSMIALSPVQWIGANNGGTFGTGPGRMTVDCATMRWHDGAALRYLVTIYGDEEDVRFRRLTVTRRHPP